MTQPEQKVADFQHLMASPVLAHREGLAFLRGKGTLNDALRRLVADLERRGIDYSVIGAVALNQYGYRRFTEDIGLLMSPADLARFQAELVGRGYRPAYPGATTKFRTSEDNVPIEVVQSGGYPGDGRPKPVRFPEPTEAQVVIDGVRTVTLEKLVELELASGTTAPHRLRDLADVQELIRVRGLDAGSADRLDPSVLTAFLELQRAVADAPPDG